MKKTFTRRELLHKTISQVKTSLENVSIENYDILKNFSIDLIWSLSVMDVLDFDKFSILLKIVESKFKEKIDEL